MSKILWVGNAPGGNYTLAINEQVARLGLAPGLWAVEVAHDDECAVFRGNQCGCNAEVSIVEAL